MGPPLMAAKMGMDVAKEIGAQASVTVIDFYYQPMIKVGKGKDRKEVPDPHYPKGIRFAIPAWFVVAVLLAGAAVSMNGIIMSLLPNNDKKGNPMSLLDFGSAAKFFTG